MISSFQCYKTTESDEHDCVGNRKYMKFDGGANVAPQRSLITAIAAIIGFLLMSLGTVLLEYRSQMVK